MTTAVVGRRADRFPGRRVLTGCFIVLAVTSGLAFYGLAVYLNAFSREKGWPVASISLATTLFLGGWNGPGVETYPWLGPVWFLAKVFFFLFLYIWLRGTLPRFRYDQLMNFGWKVLLPAALFNVVLASAIGVLFL